MRRPTSGQLYEAFKNANRTLPDELKMRMSAKAKKRKATTVTNVSADKEVNPTYEEKGTATS